MCAAMLDCCGAPTGYPYSARLRKVVCQRSGNNMAGKKGGLPSCAWAGTIPRHDAAADIAHLGCMHASCSCIVHPVQVCTRVIHMLVRAVSLLSAAAMQRI